MKEEIRDMEKRKQDEDERHFYMNLHLVTDKDLSTYGGFDIGFEGEMSGPKALDAPYDTVRILKTVPLSDVRLQIAEQFEVDLKNVALWSVSSRLNKTARLGNLFTEDSYAKSTFCFNYSCLRIKLKPDIPLPRRPPHLRTNFDGGIKARLH